MRYVPSSIHAFHVALLPERDFVVADRWPLLNCLRNDQKPLTCSIRGLEKVHVVAFSR